MLQRTRARLTLPTAVPVCTALALITLLAAGCSGHTKSTSSPGRAAAATVSASGSAGTPQASRDTSAGAAGATRTTSFRAPGGGFGTIDAGLVGLKADGRLATLNLLWTPRYTDIPPTREISLFDMFSQHSPAVTLVDSTNLKRYVVVQDSHNVELGAGALQTKTVNNTPVSASYTFAAPPADVRTVDVYVDDRMLFDHVPVDR